MIKDQIEELIKPVVEELGLMLWGIDYLSQGRHSLLRVYIDKVNGVEVSDCEQASRQISATLDVEDPISGQYNLEVSSPGIPRPLFKSWQYEQYIGKKIDLRLYQPDENRRKWTGQIVSVNDQVVEVNVDETVKQFAFTNIVRAYLTDE